MRSLRSAWIWLFALLVTLTASGTTQAEPATLVFINGSPTAVYFNDGDSFRVLEGPLEGVKSRLAGFNTLESHGPVHAWGDWNPKELYALAKYATLNARRGVWHCESKDMHRDGYGRILFQCPDLRRSQVSNGFAHVMTVGDEQASPDLLRVQWDAIVHRRGMWAHGVPAFVVTSVHSVNEGYEGRTYNRVVSTVDGMSEQWFHNQAYNECEKACYMAKELPMADALQLATELRADPKVAEAIRGIPDVVVALAVNEYIALGKVRHMTSPAGMEALGARLREMAAQGRFNAAKLEPTSCMIYVSFERRYREPKPSCLKW